MNNNIHELAHELADLAVNPNGYADAPDESDARDAERSALEARIVNVVKEYERAQQPVGLVVLHARALYTALVEDNGDIRVEVNQEVDSLEDAIESLESSLRAAGN